MNVEYNILQLFPVWDKFEVLFNHGKEVSLMNRRGQGMSGSHSGSIDVIIHLGLTLWSDATLLLHVCHCFDSTHSNFYLWLVCMILPPRVYMYVCVYICNCATINSCCIVLMYMYCI